jgi:inorganic pyrophosphatase
MTGLDCLPLRARTGAFNAIVETQRGSRVKFSYDTETGQFRAKKLLALGYVFPFPFGFLPSTRGADGDPIDVLLLTDAVLPMGTLVELKPLGIIEIEQNEDGRRVRNDRLLGAPLLEGDEGRIERLSEVSERLVYEIEEFLVGYQRAENKQVRIIGRGDAGKAEQLIQQAAQ